MRVSAATIRGPTVLLSVALVSGCQAFTLASLEPRPITRSAGILPLFVTFGDDLFRTDAAQGVAVATDYATLFRRDLEANVFVPDDRRWGYAELRLTFEDTRVTGGGWALFGGQLVTLMIPAFLGAPMSIHDRTIQAEVAILDSRRIPVAHYVLTGRERFSARLYYNDEERQAGTEAFKDLLDELHRRLAEDVRDINGRLRDTGAVP